MTITERDCKIPMNLMIKHEPSEDAWAGVGATFKATREPPHPQAGKFYFPSQRK